MKSRIFKILVMTGACAASLCTMLSADKSPHRPVGTKPEEEEVEKKQIDKLSRAPNLKLLEALEIATAHLKEERIDLAGHFLESIRLSEVEGQNLRYWKLTWLPNAHAIGGEIWVHVSMDRQLKPSIEWGR